MLNTKENCLEKPEATRHSICKDGRWKWIVVLGSHLCHQLVWGMIRSIGVLLVQWKLYFDTGAVVVSSVASVMSASFLLTGLVAGFLCKRYGCRLVTIIGGILSALGFLIGSQAQSILYLCITVGGISGMGFSMAYTASAVIPGHYFEKHFALANSISCAGTGVGVMIIPPIVQLLIEVYGWRGSMVVISMILANVCVCGAVFRPVPTDMTNTNKESTAQDLTPTVEANSKMINCVNTTRSAVICNNKTSRDRKQRNGILALFIWICDAIGLHLFLKSYRFIVICFTQMLVGVSYSGVMVHIVNHIGQTFTEATKVEAAFIISVVGIGSLFARASHGFLVDRRYLSPIAGYTTAIVVGSIAILISPVIKQYPWFAVYAGILGTCMGLNMSLLRVLVKKYLGVDDLAQGIALSAVVFFGVGDLIGPLLSGWLYDVTGQYTISFWLMGGLLFLAGPTMLLVPLLRRFDLRHTIDSRVRMIKFTYSTPKVPPIGPDPIFET